MNDDTAIIFGKKIAHHSAKMRHYTLPIRLPDNEKRINETFSCIGGQNEKAVEKLHKQISHPSPEKLKNFLSTAEKSDPALLHQVDKVIDSCETRIN